MTDSHFKTIGQSLNDRNRRRTIVLLFSGQGSQYYNMAKTLYYQHDWFRRTMDDLDRRVQCLTGESMLSVMYDTRREIGDRFVRVRYTHPAIFCVQYALADLLRHKGWLPDYVFGMSLGEFVAAAFAGVIEPEQALDAVIMQALILEKHCSSDGGMLAIMAPLTLFSEHPEIFHSCDLAGVNYSEHFVIAGNSREIVRIQSFLQERDVLNQLLPVDYGFHSAHIDPASKQYLDYLKSIQVNVPSIPVVSCFTAREVISYSSEHFWRVTREPMRFSVALQWFETQVSEGRGVIYIDLGPGGTLANFIKRGLDINSRSSFQSVITPFGQEVERLQDVEQSFLQNMTRG